MNLITILTGFLLLPFTLIHAQLTVESLQKKQIMRITMIDGEKYYGEIISDDEDYLILQTASAKLTLKAEDIKSVKLKNNLGNTEYPNLHGNRYFAFSGARPLKKKEGYYQNALVVLNGASYGITNHFSIAGGLIPANTFMRFPFWYLNPRVGIELGEYSSLGVGVIIIRLRSSGTEIVPYVAISFGQEDSNITFALGYGTLNNLLRENAPILNFSGTHRISKRLSLISENYFTSTNPGNSFLSDLTSNTILGVLGCRYFKKKNSFDFGIAIHVTYGVDYSFGSFTTLDLPFPYLGYSRAF